VALQSAASVGRLTGAANHTNSRRKEMSNEVNDQLIDLIKDGSIELVCEYCGEVIESYSNGDADLDYCETCEHTVTGLCAPWIGAPT
jgi:hypothetical protein